MNLLSKDEELKLKPPLKWAGGKRWLAPLIAGYWATHSSKRLVEPLCGGISVAMHLRPQRALLNDINIHLINYYNWLKKGLDIEYELFNDRIYYYQCRKRFNSLIAEGKEETTEAASLFYYLNRTGYNGLCRFNKKGYFNVPFGRYRNINYRTDFSGYDAVFANWEFTGADFEKLATGEDDFIYADPPYDVEFRQYSEQGFPWDDQVRLARWLATRQGPVILSNQATERIVELYESLKFTLLYLKAPRKISCNGDRSPANEVLALRNL